MTFNKSFNKLLRESERNTRDLKEADAKVYADLQALVATPFVAAISEEVGPDEMRDSLTALVSKALGERISLPKGVTVSVAPGNTEFGVSGEQPTPEGGMFGSAWAEASFDIVDGSLDGAVIATGSARAEGSVFAEPGDKANTYSFENLTLTLNAVTPPLVPVAESLREGQNVWTKDFYGVALRNGIWVAWSPVNRAYLVLFSRPNRVGDVQNATQLRIINDRDEVIDYLKYDLDFRHPQSPVAESALGSSKFTWTTVGSEYNGTPEQKRKIEAAIDRMKWLPLKRGLQMSMMAGDGIKSAIRELRIPKVSHVADSTDLAPFGFYGIIGHYTNGDVAAYVVDTGTELVPVASELFSQPLSLPESVRPLREMRLAYDMWTVTTRGRASMSDPIRRLAVNMDGGAGASVGGNDTWEFEGRAAANKFAAKAQALGAVVLGVGKVTNAYTPGPEDEKLYRPGSPYMVGMRQIEAVKPKGDPRFMTEAERKVLTESSIRRDALEREVWKKTHPDYKGGSASDMRIMWLDPQTGGTVSGPVSKMPDKELIYKAQLLHIIPKGQTPTLLYPADYTPESIREQDDDWSGVMQSLQRGVDTWLADDEFADFSKWAVSHGVAGRIDKKWDKGMWKLALRESRVNEQDAPDGANLVVYAKLKGDDELYEPQLAVQDADQARSKAKELKDAGYTDVVIVVVPAEVLANSAPKVSDPGAQFKLLGESVQEGNFRGSWMAATRHGAEGAGWEGRPPRFRQGDRVSIRGGQDTGEVWSVEDWDEDLGDRRYQVKLDRGGKQWVNEKSLELLDAPTRAQVRGRRGAPVGESIGEGSLREGLERMTVSEFLAGRRSAVFGTLTDLESGDTYNLSFTPDNSNIGAYSVVAQGGGKREHWRMMYKGAMSMREVQEHFTEYLNTDSPSPVFSVTLKGSSAPRFQPATTRPSASSGKKLVDTIRPGDRVTIVNRFGQESTGKAVMRSSVGGWVLNMGGPHGTPGLADDNNIVKVVPGKRGR